LWHLCCSEVSISPLFRWPNSVNHFTQGAIGYAKLNATTGYQIVGVIRQENGRFPPLGVNVTDKATGKDVGLVAEDGFVYLSGIQENSTLHLTWGDNTCEVTPPNQSNISESAIILPCKTVK
ncbi:FimD/PapC C-terminal domain-containing protein, partial [Escherichia coli]